VHRIATWTNQTFSENIKGSLRWDLYKFIHNPYENARAEVFAKYTLFGIGSITGASEINFLAVTNPTIYINTISAISGAYMNDTLPSTFWGITGYGINYTIDGIINDSRGSVFPVDSRIAP